MFLFLQRVMFSDLLSAGHQVCLDRGVSRACEERRCLSPGMTRSKTPDNIYESYLDLTKTACSVSAVSVIQQM